MKGGLKEGLLKLISSLESAEIDTRYRRTLIPILLRILFGRLSARAASGRTSKDTPESRRSAVLNFISVICTSKEDMYPFIYLMLRNYVPADFPMNPVETHTQETKMEVLAKLSGVTPNDLEDLPSQVHIGLLHLLETVITNLGHRVVQYVSHFTGVVISLCKVSEVKCGSDLEVTNTVEVNNQRGTPSDMSSIRTLSFRRLSQIFIQFASTVDFSEFASSMWTAIGGSVKLLPVTVVGSERVPAMLFLLQALSSHPRLLVLLMEYKEAVPCTIKCIASTSSNAVIDSTLTFIENLLSGDIQHVGSGELSGKDIIRHHADLILHQFMLRLSNDHIPMSAEDPSSEDKPTGKLQLRPATWRRELRILCQISEIIGRETNAVKSQTSGVHERLCALLLPFLDQGKGMTEDDQMNVINILNALVSSIGTDVAVSHYAICARLLGPSKAKPGIESMQVRQAIAGVVHKLSLKYSSKAEKVANVVLCICKPHRKHVDEMDFDKVLPAIQDLGNSDSDSNWASFSIGHADEGPTEADVKALSPLIYSCFHLLHNDDGVVSRGAFRALKALISLAATQAALSSDAQDGNVEVKNEWIMLLERQMVPVIRVGLSTRNAAVRRMFILLVAETARVCRDFSLPNLYGDLAVLIRDDEQDLDFFVNITHVQMHRRGRALQRLRTTIKAKETEQCQFTVQSLSNILLPIVLHPIYEAKTKAEENFAAEAIATVGAISRQLSWSKYSSLLWTTLTQFHRHPEQEHYLVGLLCAVIDGFHFDISTSSGDKNSEISETGSGAICGALNRRIIPKIEGLLTKEKVDQNGSTIKTLRSSVVLALTKLFKKFTKKTFESRLPRLLSVICDALKSRDSDSRDVARNTLSKMVVEIDIAYLADVLRELTVTLREGYQLHVRSATVHSIILALSTHYKPSTKCTDSEALTLPFDRCVPALVDLIQQDLFGTAQERRDAEGVNGRYVKEAAGLMSFNTLEITASLVLFRPTAVHQPIVMGIHALVSPFLERLRLPNVQASTIRRIKECLTRIVAGLSRNPSVTLEEVLPFVYATAAPFIGWSGFNESSTLNDDDSSDEEDPVRAIRVSGGKTNEEFYSGTTKQSKKGNSSVAEWRPSTLKSVKTSKDALEARTKDQQDLRRVQDGAAAPKLTGSSRYSFSNTAFTSRMNDPSAISAVSFCLRLLYSTLKKNKKLSQEENFSALIDPFVPLLTSCVCECRETDVVLLSLRCLGLFMFRDLPSKARCSAALGSKTLEMLGSSGAGSNQNDELTQSCFKMLTLLINVDHKRQPAGLRAVATPGGHGEQALAKTGAMPLDSEQMKVLISYLRESIADSDHHNPALGLIKAIISRRYVSPEFYDMMDTMLELTARSGKASLRQVSQDCFYLFQLQLSRKFYHVLTLSCIVVSIAMFWDLH